MAFGISSLGTNATLLESQNLGQNGYRKYEDGLLVQWGKGGGYTTYHTYYFPSSFYDTNYSFTTCVEYKNLSESVVLTPYINNKNKSSFVGGITAKSGDNPILASAWNFYWIAIGKWK